MDLCPDDPQHGDRSVAKPHGTRTSASRAAPQVPGKRKESVGLTEIFESENGGLALHQANGLGRKRNLRHNTSHKRNLRHNTSHTQADDHTIRLWSLLVGGRTLPTAPLYLSQAVCNVLGRKPVSYSVPRLVPQSRTV